MTYEQTDGTEIILMSFFFFILLHNPKKSIGKKKYKGKTIKVCEFLPIVKTNCLTK